MSKAKGPAAAPDRDQEFIRLVEHYQGPVRRMCCLCLYDRTLADDAAQETFLKIYRTLSSGEMSDALYGTDGSMVYYSMGDPSGEMDDSGNAVILFQLMEITPEAGEEDKILELPVSVPLKKAR